VRKAPWRNTAFICASHNPGDQREISRFALDNNMSTGGQLPQSSEQRTGPSATVIGSQKTGSQPVKLYPPRNWTHKHTQMTSHEGVVAHVTIVTPQCDYSFLPLTLACN